MSRIAMTAAALAEYHGEDYPGDGSQDWDELAIVALEAADAADPLIQAVVAEMTRQDEKHGPFEGTTLGRSRLALACLEDEVREAVEAWRRERSPARWWETRDEVLQVAAVALRTLRDAL